MMSAKGFLEPGPDNRPRMTAAQAYQVTYAVSVAIDQAVDRSLLLPDLALVTKRVAIEAIAGYPIDRSCHSCDHLNSDNFCLHWSDSVPKEAQETGCDSFRDEYGESIPF